MQMVALYGPCTHRQPPKGSPMPTDPEPAAETVAAAEQPTASVGCSAAATVSAAGSGSVGIGDPFGGCLCVHGPYSATICIAPCTHKQSGEVGRTLLAF